MTIIINLQHSIPGGSSFMLDFSLVFLKTKSLVRPSFVLLVYMIKTESSWSRYFLRTPESRKVTSSDPSPLA
jgi:hypothetical protein